jgi:YHS domain-containing protein
MKCSKILIFALLFVLIAIGCVPTEGIANTKKKQTTCPVMGDKIPCLILNKDIYLDYEGNRVYFCTMNCLLKFKKDPEKYIKKLEDQGITFEPVPKTRPNDWNW